METRKKGGRRKIDLKKIEKKSSLQVTFSKRRKGLFKKAAELSVLSGAHVCVIAQSPAGKIFATGGCASINAIIDRYLAGTASSNSSSSNYDEFRPEQQDEDENKCTEIMEKIEEEKAEEKSLRESKGDNAEGFWWDFLIDDVNLNELEDYAAAMEGLKTNVEGRIEETATSSSLLIPNVNVDCLGEHPLPRFDSYNSLPFDTNPIPITDE